MLDQRGNVFVEAVVSVAILVIAIVPTFGLLTLGPGIQKQSVQQTVAMNIARTELEYYQSLTGQWASLTTGTWTPAPPGLSPAPPSLAQFTNAADYTVTTKIQAGSDPSLNLKNVTVTVSWTDNRGASYNVSLVTAISKR